MRYAVWLDCCKCSSHTLSGHFLHFFVSILQEIFAATLPNISIKIHNFIINLSIMITNPRILKMRICKSPHFIYLKLRQREVK